MTDPLKLKAVVEALESLTIDDIVDKDGAVLPDIARLAGFHQSLMRKYYDSPYYREAMYKAYEKTQKRREAASKLGSKKDEWCSKYLKVGDIVKVITSGANPWRTVVRIHANFIDGTTVDKNGNYRPGGTFTTSFSRITHLKNPTTGIFERIAVDG